MHRRVGHLPEKILKEARTVPEGEIISAKRFLTLASRAAIDQALKRLVAQGTLQKVARGMYVSPVEGRFGKRSPAPEKIVQSIARLRGETVTNTGAVEANSLGLSQQVPVKEVFLTSGKNLKLSVGNREVPLNRAPKWMFLLGESQAGRAVRALAWMGEEHAKEWMPVLKGKLSQSEWESLLSVRTRLPVWMNNALAEAHG
jgi:hypothetical protein